MLGIPLLNGKCAIVTSYKPSTADIKGEETGDGFTERLRQYDIYRKMLSDWFRVPPEEALGRVEEFETAAKKRFIESPGKDDWRGNKFKEREVKREIKRYIQDPKDVDRIFTLVKEQRGDY